MTKEAKMDTAIMRTPSTLKIKVGTEEMIPIKDRTNVDTEAPLLQPKTTIAVARLTKWAGIFSDTI